MKKVLIVGGNGTLGRAVVSAFAEGWQVTSVDLEDNPQAHCNSRFHPSLSHERQAAAFIKETTGKFHAIVCVAGGFEAGQIDDPEVFHQMDRMLHCNLYPALYCGHLACHVLSEGGLLVLTGAATPFKSSAPGVLSYAIAKTAIHSLALNLATGQGLPNAAAVVTLLPEVIDTPANRAGGAQTDTSQWVDPGSIATLVRSWGEGRGRPANGSFVLLRREGDNLHCDFV